MGLKRWLFGFSLLSPLFGMAQNLSWDILNKEQNTLVYQDIHRPDRYKLNFLKRHGDSLFLYTTQVYRAKDSLFGYLMSNGKVFNDISTAQIGKDAYIWDRNFQPYQTQNKTLLTQPMAVDTFIMRQGTILLVSGDKLKLYADFQDKKLMAKAAKTESYSPTPMTLQEKKTTKQGATYRYLFDGPKALEDSYSYDVLKDFWVVFYSYPGEGDLQLIRVNDKVVSW